MNTFFASLRKKLHDQPAGFYTILYTEVCALFGQFSIAALLTLYMTSTLHTGDRVAFSSYGAFTTFIYAIPLLGGYFADRIIGFRAALLSGILLMTAGNIILTVQNIHFLYWGLAVFATGCGFFTPSITAIMGQLYTREDGKRDNAFIIYYIAKNIGVLLATVIGSLLATRYGYNYAFLLATAVMMSGYLVFLAGSKNHRLRTDGLSGNTSLTIKSGLLLSGTFLLLILLAEKMIATRLTRYFVLVTSVITLIYLGVLYRKFSRTDRKRLITILVSISLMMVFFMFLGQGGTTLNLFIERIVNRTVAGYTIPPAMFYGLDPLFMILTGGAVMAGLAKINPGNEVIAGFYKISAGLIALGLGFLVFAGAACVMIHSGGKPSVSWVVFAYFLFPVAELCTMPIVISLITRIAPRGHEGFMIGIYMLGCAIAGYLMGAFSAFGNIDFPLNSPAQLVAGSKIYLHVFLVTSITLLCIALLSLTILWLNGKRHARALA